MRSEKGGTFTRMARTTKARFRTTLLRVLGFSTTRSSDISIQGSGREMYQTGKESKNGSQEHDMKGRLSTGENRGLGSILIPKGVYTKGILTITISTGRASSNGGMGECTKGIGRMVKCMGTGYTCGQTETDTKGIM